MDHLPALYGSKSHKKKTSSDQYVRERWLWSTYEEMRQEYANGKLSLDDAADKCKMSQSAFLYNMHCSEQSSLGHPTVFSKKEEGLMRMFLFDATMLRIPRTEEMFKMDIKDFVMDTKKKVPFKNGIPGVSWCDRFKTADGNNIEFPSCEKVDDIMHEVMSLTDWASEMQNYLLHKTGGDLIDDTSKVLMMELETFEFQSNGHHKLSLLMVHNCSGQLLLPFIVHDDAVEDDIIDMYNGRMIFKFSSDGCLNPTVLRDVLSDINIGMTDVGYTPPIVVCMERDIGINFKYYTWKKCIENETVVMTLCNSMTIMFKSLGLGIFELMGSRLVDLMKKRFHENGLLCKPFNFCHLVMEVYSALIKSPKTGTHLKKTFTKFGFSAFVLKVPSQRVVSAHVEDNAGRNADNQQGLVGAEATAHCEMTGVVSSSAEAEASGDKPDENEGCAGRTFENKQTQTEVVDRVDIEIQTVLTGIQKMKLKEKEAEIASRGIKVMYGKGSEPLQNGNATS